MSCTQVNRNIVTVDNGRDIITDFDLRNGISIETEMTGKQKIFVLIRSSKGNTKVPFQTVGAASNFRKELEHMLRVMECS
jgi:hypothetical protein